MSLPPAVLAGNSAQLIATTTTTPSHRNLRPAFPVFPWFIISSMKIWVKSEIGAASKCPDTLIQDVGRCELRLGTRGAAAERKARDKSGPSSELRYPSPFSRDWQ